MEIFFEVRKLQIGSKYGDTKSARYVDDRFEGGGKFSLDFSGYENEGVGFGCGIGQPGIIFFWNQGQIPCLVCTGSRINLFQ
ncbi:hypothetical protein YC2023_007574 [Brassica napus]